MKTIVTILLLFFGFNAALACSCLAPDDKQKTEALKSSSTVFRGKVISADMSPGGDRIEVKFAVLKAWKGVPKREIVIGTRSDSAACGYNFQAGETYTVYANGNPPATNSCTMLMADEKRVREVLGEGKSAEDLPTPRSESSGSFWTRMWRKISSIFS